MSEGTAFGRAARGVFSPVRKQMGVSGGAGEGGQFLWAGPLRPQGGKAEDGLDGGFPDANDLPLAHDADGLAATRQGAVRPQFRDQAHRYRGSCAARPRPFRSRFAVQGQRRAWLLARRRSARFRASGSSGDGMR